MNRLASALLLQCLVAACGGDAQAPDAEELIDRETFIETYVDLRVAAVQSEAFRASDEQRAEILARHGVAAESLLEFADAHGRDTDFMNEIWSEVETRLEARAAEGEPQG